MNTDKILSIKNDVSYYYDQKGKLSEGIQDTLGRNLSREQYANFCDFVNQKELLKSKFNLKRFSRNFFNNPVNPDDVLKDFDIVEGWELDKLLEGIDKAILENK